MKFTIDRNNLLNALNHVQGVVERRNTIPILANVKIEAKDNNIVLTATDMDISISDKFAVEIIAEGSITTPVHTFFDIIKKLPDTAEVTLEHSDSFLKITSARCNFSLPVISANDFPIIEAGNISHNFEISRNKLSKTI